MTIVKAIFIRRRNGGPSSRLIQTFLREGKASVVCVNYEILTSYNRCFLLHPDFHCESRECFIRSRAIFMLTTLQINGIFYLQSASASQLSSV